MEIINKRGGKKKRKKKRKKKEGKRRGGKTRERSTSCERREMGVESNVS